MRDVTTYVYDMSIDHRRTHEDLLYTHFRVRTDAISPDASAKIQEIQTCGGHRFPYTVPVFTKIENDM